MAALTFQTAAKYSPVSGLITDNNFNQYKTGLTAPSFSNPNAPTVPGANGTSPAPAQSITGAGAFTPDWASLIQNDSGLRDAATALSAAGAASKDQLNQLIANAYEEFGSNIDLSKLASQLGMTQADIQNALGPDAQRLAQENTDAGLSTQARLDQANKSATRQLLQSLNKRGILNSGETAHDLDQQNLAYRQAQSDAYQKFLGYLQQYQQGYLTAQQGNAQSLAQAYNSAADRAVQTNQGSAGVTATLDHIDANGNAVYRGPDGSFYNADGSAYAAAQNPQPQAPPVTLPDLYTPYGGSRATIGRVAA